MSAELRLIEKIKKNCAACPENIALIQAGSERCMTYAGLWEYSGRVYAFLKQEGIGREDAVMIKVPRGGSIRSSS